MKSCSALLLLCMTAAVPAADPQVVRAELGAEVVWTGQAVPLVITLYSPGPFSGTAAFEFPEVVRTVFVAMGSPLVGSDEVDGETYFTQRHEFQIYTQLAGEVAIRPFRVRFAGKKDFTSDPQPMEGRTQQLHFESKRPPGTEAMKIVVSAQQVEMRQKWDPADTTQFLAGDVLEREITRQVQGSTAMMLPAVTTQAPDGVKVYARDPGVSDRTERGEISAERRDTIKYQFQRAGSFTLPDVTFVWWDPQQEEIRTERAVGVTVLVESAAATETISDLVAHDEPVNWARQITKLLLVCLLLAAAYRPVRRWSKQWRSEWNSPLRTARQQLHAACQANDPMTAYAAMSAWLNADRLVSEGNSIDAFWQRSESQDLYEQWQGLTRHVFSSSPGASDWDGRLFWGEFSRLRRIQPSASIAGQTPILPPLNPTAAYE